MPTTKQLFKQIEKIISESPDTQLNQSLLLLAILKQLKKIGDTLKEHNNIIKFQHPPHSP